MPLCISRNQDVQIKKDSLESHDGDIIQIHTYEHRRPLSVGLQFDTDRIKHLGYYIWNTRIPTHGNIRVTWYFLLGFVHRNR
jgi:hypothetical protein